MSQLNDNKPPFAWQQLTELVARAVGVQVEYCPHAQNDGVYINKETGEAFDPVRNDGDAARLAVARSLYVQCEPGRTGARHFGAVNSVEHDHANGGDPMKSYRLAVCRAVLEAAR